MQSRHETTNIEDFHQEERGNKSPESYSRKLETFLLLSRFSTRVAWDSFPRLLSTGDRQGIRLNIGNLMKKSHAMSMYNILNRKGSCEKSCRENSF